MSDTKLKVYITQSSKEVKRCQNCGTLLAVIASGKVTLAGRVTLTYDDGLVCHGRCPNQKCGERYTFSRSDFPGSKNR